ncbi:hypothetical protein [Micromonospora sp. CPCC 206061]|uniref:hypothetical protein n=1 Tax=Micromonospora sp. CPCC 206061 TaxID=3122410 RepID=UPI002FF3224B
MRLVLAVAALAFALTACGGETEDGGIATAGNGSAASPSASAPAGSASGDREEQMLKFTACMRGEGVDMPDPEPGGGIRIQGSDPAKTDAAMAKCRQLLPNGGEMRRMNAADMEKARQYSKCMRDNGVTAFPDPDPETGGIMLRGGPDSGLDPNSATFQAAQKTCESLRPQRAGGAG